MIRKFLFELFESFSGRMMTSGYQFCGNKWIPKCGWVNHVLAGRIPLTWYVFTLHHYQVLIRIKEVLDSNQSSMILKMDLQTRLIVPFTTRIYSHEPPLPLVSLLGAPSVLQLPTANGHQLKLIITEEVNWEFSSRLPFKMALFPICPPIILSPYDDSAKHKNQKIPQR